MCVARVGVLVMCYHVSIPLCTEPPTDLHIQKECGLCILGSLIPPVCYKGGYWEVYHYWEMYQMVSSGQLIYL